jgi:hypothetical protein
MLGTRVQYRLDHQIVHLAAFNLGLCISTSSCCSCAAVAQYLGPAVVLQTLKYLVLIASILSAALSAVNQCSVEAAT